MDEKDRDDSDNDDDSIREQQVYERENMANLILFEVEVGDRTIVIGGFSTNGWVTKLRAENFGNSGSIDDEDMEKI